MKHYLGIDLGGTNIAVGVVNEKYEIIAKASHKTLANERTNDEIIEEMVAVSKEAVEKASLTMDEIEWVGIGIPGTINCDTGMIEYSNNIKFEKVPVVEKMEKLMGKKCYINNDANVAAFGEMLAGCGRGTKSLVAITLGTGVGGGIVIDGKIFSGNNFAGAELGHTVTVVDGEQCTCGRKGCWEAYASGTACIRQTKRAMEEHPESVMWKLVGDDISRVTARTSFDAMRKGDPVGTEVVNTYIRHIAEGVTNMVNIFQPEILCIGGGICNEGDTLLNPIREYVAKNRFSKYSEKQTVIVKAELGNDAGIIGAAMLGTIA